MEILGSEGVFQHELVPISLLSLKPGHLTITTTTMGKQATISAHNLAGFENFVRTNPKSDTFPVLNFHHVDGDATSAAARFSRALGIPLAAKSDLSTGNSAHASYLLRYVKNLIGTAESGLNSVVLANNEENVLLALSEPVFGTKRRSPIQTFLEHNEGAGVQHLALVTEDIFRTLREMRERSGDGGFEFMPSPPPTYYGNMKSRVGEVFVDV